MKWYSTARASYAGSFIVKKKRAGLSITHYCSSNASQPESLGIKEHQGCLLGWEIVDQLQQASKRINLNIPIAEKGNEISMYAGKGNAEPQYTVISNDEVQEIINPGLDRLQNCLMLWI